MIRFALALSLLASPALAQTAPGIPQPLQGAWFTPGCAAPEAMLFVTPRAAARLPTEGTTHLLRFVEMAERGGWTVATGRGTGAPRLAMQGSAEALRSVEPSPKTRDDRLPGEAPVTEWQRCPTPPASFSALHGEGLAFLGALERLEAACTGPAEACLGALMAVGDVSGDGSLSTAELARLLRGAAWVLAAQEGVANETLATASGAGMIGGLLSARLLVDSLDYDGDGRLSAVELRQDRAPLPAPGGTAAGRPFRSESVSDGFGTLRGLVEGFIGTR